jgi:hypothetical protein
MQFSSQDPRDLAKRRWSGGQLTTAPAQGSQPTSQSKSTSSRYIICRNRWLGLCSAYLARAFCTTEEKRTRLDHDGSILGDVRFDRRRKGDLWWERTDRTRTAPGSSKWFLAWTWARGSSFSVQLQGEDFVDEM